MKRITPQFPALCVLFAAYLAAPSAVASAQIPEYDIESIGTVSPIRPDDSWTSGINNTGGVAGTSFYTNNLGNTSFRPVLYSDAGLTPLMTYGSGSLASINTAGDAVGFKIGFAAKGKAHIWNASGGHANLHYGSLETSIASAISDSGEVIGSYDFLNANPINIRRGFYRDPAGNYQTMPTLGGQASAAADINAFGQIVGLAEDASSTKRAVSWQVGSAVQPLGLAGELSSTTGINNRGQIVGTWVDAQNLAHGFLIHQGAILDLPTLAAQQDSLPTDINQAGFIVGGNSSLGTGRQAVLWDRQQNVVDLQTLLPTNSGWDLQVATGINDLGEISGTGILNGKKRGFRMIPRSLRPRISGAQPAIAGSLNSTIFAAGFEAQTTVHFFWGTQLGRTSAFGYYLDIANPHWIGQSTADDFGRTDLAVTIPLSLIGRRILTQAVDLTSGKPSILMEQRVL